MKILSSAAQNYKADRTVLRLTFPETAFGIAVEDLQSNDCVYVPHAGVFAVREPAPVTLADYLKKIASQKTGIPADQILISATHTHSAAALTPAFQSDPDPDEGQGIAAQGLYADPARRESLAGRLLPR